MQIKSKIFYWYVVFVASYTALLLLPAPDQATLVKYHLSSLSLKVLDFTIIVPEAVIWFAAFYGYQKLFNYSRLIGRSRDGKQMAKLARGLLILSIGLPFSAILSSILSIVANHVPSFTAPSVIIKNYVGVLFPLAAFIWINVAARGLSELAKSRTRFRTLNIVVLLATALGTIFCCLIVSAHKDLRLTYHMSPQLVMLTLALPYMYIWFLGLFAVAELYAYSQKVAGAVYRPAWNQVAFGLGAIVLLSILLEYLTTLSSWLTQLSLGWILLLLYVLLLLLALAYIVVALGAKKLIKIEEV